MKVVPLGDKVVVKRLEAAGATPGGILLPDSAREQPKEGKVLSVGDGKLTADGKRARPQVSEGDRVLFSAGPPGTRARLYARVCQYVQKAGCINPSGGNQPPQAHDYYNPDAPKA